MPALRQLLAAHGHLLVLDAASTAVQAGVLRRDGAAFWQRPAGEAGTALFTGTSAALSAAGTGLDEIGAFVFCEGPGSMLGTRTVAMALRTWLTLGPRPTFAYQSLELAARHFARKYGRRDFTIIADARRDSWHARTVGADGGLTPLRRIATADLPPGDLVHPDHFRTWSALPRPATPCPYDLAALFTGLDDLDCFHASTAPDAYQAEAPDYRKWTAQVHSAATASPR